MTIDELLALINAGYTKEEITALTQSGSVDNTPPANSQANTEPEANSDQTQVSTNAPSTEPEADNNTAKALAELTAQVQTLVKAQQASNRANTSNTARAFATTDDILAGLINPTKNNGGN